MIKCNSVASLLKGHGGIKKEAKRRRERKAPIHLLDNNEPMAASDLEVTDLNVKSLTSVLLCV